MKSISAILVLCLLVSVPLTAFSEVVICPPSLNSVTVDQLVVAKDSYCYLQDVEVLGDIRVESGAILVGSRISVHGNILATGADTVFISTDDPDYPSFVGGSISLVKLDSAQIILTLVEGNLLFAQNTFGLANSNEISGNLKFVGNDLAQLNNNWVGKNLICQGNEEFTTISYRNVVDGNVLAQCEEFVLTEG
jgi:hypothetical protein